MHQPLLLQTLCKKMWHFCGARYNMQFVITYCLPQVNVMLTSLVRFLGSVLYRVSLAHVVVCYFYAFLSIVYNTKQKDF